MPPSGLHIYLWPRMTLTFDLMTSKVDRFMPMPHDHLCQLASKSAFIRFQNMFTDCNRQTNGRKTDE